jgi:antitoxin VapB
MNTSKPRIFKSNRSKAVRLARDVALPGWVRDVEIIKIGSRRIIVPAGQSWGDWFSSPGVSRDFMEGREQPEDGLSEPPSPWRRQ